jgi:hypothetical protein
MKTAAERSLVFYRATEEVVGVGTLSRLAPANLRVEVTLGQEAEQLLTLDIDASKYSDPQVLVGRYRVLNGAPYSSTTSPSCLRSETASAQPSS